VNNEGVTWKWVVGILVTILLLGGGAWATSIQAQVTDANRNAGELKADIAVIKERMRAFEENQKEERDARKEADKKLDEIRDLLKKKDATK